MQALTYPHYSIVPEVQTTMGMLLRFHMGILLQFHMGIWLRYRMRLPEVQQISDGDLTTVLSTIL